MRDESFFMGNHNIVSLHVIERFPPDPERDGDLWEGFLAAGEVANGSYDLRWIQEGPLAVGDVVGQVHKGRTVR